MIINSFLINRAGTLPVTRGDVTRAPVSDAYRRKLPKSVQHTHLHTERTVSTYILGTSPEQEAS